ncbi:MAG TPA: hypothetical protein VFG23_16005 [Polyangia bacterium]|nr:hypothetical protein [Polyangia bacterium]
MTFEEGQALIIQQNAAILREVRELRAERQHQGGHWGSRAEAAKYYALSVDSVDARIADKTLRAKKLGEEPAERRDKLGRRIDRRRVLVWIEGSPRTEAEIDAMANEART